MMKTFGKGSLLAESKMFARSDICKYFRENGLSTNLHASHQETVDESTHVGPTAMLN